MKRQIKSANALVQATIEEEDSDLSDDEGTNNFQAGMAMINEVSPKLGSYITLVQAKGK